MSMIPDLKNMKYLNSETFISGLLTFWRMPVLTQISQNSRATYEPLHFWIALKLLMHPLDVLMPCLDVLFVVVPWFKGKEHFILLYFVQLK